MRLILLGNGGLASEIEELAHDCGHSVIARLETDKLLFELERLSYDGIAFAVGKPTTKRVFAEVLGKKMATLPWVSLVSPGAKISPSAYLCSSSIVQYGTVVMAGVVVEPHVFLNLNVTVGHGARIGAYSSANPGANISGNVTLGDHCLVGTGAQIIEKLTIGAECTIGAGAVVTKDLPTGALAKGVPARWT